MKMNTFSYCMKYYEMDNHYGEYETFNDFSHDALVGHNGTTCCSDSRHFKIIMKKLLVILLCCLPLSLKSQALLDFPENVDGKVVEEYPMFPGGIREMHKYIRQNMQYPEDAKKMKIQGKAISFVFCYENTQKF